MHGTTVQRQVWMIQKVRIISPSLSNRIKLESSDSKSNRISKLRRHIARPIRRGEINRIRNNATYAYRDVENRAAPIAARRRMWLLQLVHKGLNARLLPCENRLTFRADTRQVC